MGLSAQGQKKLLRLTTTTAMITVNTIVFFTVPDIITFLYPEIKTSIFYIMNMNKVGGGGGRQTIFIGWVTGEEDRRSL